MYERIYRSAVHVGRSVNAAALISVYMVVQVRELCNSMANGGTVDREKLMELSHHADHTTSTLKCG